jgi:hypothetical protein
MKGEESYDELLRELNLARDLLLLAKIKEIREEIRTIRPLAILRDEFGPHQKGSERILLPSV